MLDKTILSIFRVDAKLKNSIYGGHLEFQMSATETAFYGKQNQISLKRLDLCSAECSA